MSESHVDTVARMTPSEFMEAHGEQVLTALRTTVEFWQDAAAKADDEPVKRLAEDQVRSWQSIYAEATYVMDA
jgi:hypothetical protein